MTGTSGLAIVDEPPVSQVGSDRRRPRKGTTTAQGHPRAVFHRSIERRNLPVAETTLRELGRPTLAELLELTILIAEREPHRHARVSARWLLRYFVRGTATIDDAALVTACLVGLQRRCSGETS